MQVWEALMVPHDINHQPKKDKTDDWDRSNEDSLPHGRLFDIALLRLIAVRLKLVVVHQSMIAAGPQMPLRGVAGIRAVEVDAAAVPVRAAQLPHARSGRCGGI